MKPPPSDALQNLLGRHWQHLPATEVGQLLETNLETGLDLIQALYLVNCRSLRHSILSIGPFRNGWLGLGIAGVLLLQAAITYRCS